jgi:hypothetical protein
LLENSFPASCSPPVLIAVFSFLGLKLIRFVIKTNRDIKKRHTERNPGHNPGPEISSIVAGNFILMVNIYTAISIVIIDKTILARFI